MRGIARDMTVDALEVAKRIMANEDASPQARMLAVKEILDRGWGKPSSTVDVTSQGQGLTIGAIVIEGK